MRTLSIVELDQVSGGVAMGTGDLPGCIVGPMGLGIGS